MNIGILVFSKPRGYLNIKYSINEDRIKSFSSEVDLSLITQYLNAWESICQGSPQGGEIGSLEPASRFRWLTASKSTILQCSPAHSGLSSSPESVILELFIRYVQ